MNDKSSNPESSNSKAKTVGFLNIDYPIRPNGAGIANINADLGIQKLRIQDKVLILGDEKIHGLEFDDTGVSWEHSTGSAYCEGRLSANASPIYLEGVIRIGKTKDTATEYPIEGCIFGWKGHPAASLRLTATNHHQGCGLQQILHHQNHPETLCGKNRSKHINGCGLGRWLVVRRGV